MTEDLWRGSLAETPLPLLLIHFWERRKSGTLRLKAEAGERSLLILRGEQAPADGFFSGELFRKRLLASRVIGVLQMEDCAGFARERGVSLPRAIIERGALGSDRVFELATTDEDRAAYARKNGWTFTLAHMTAAAQEAYGAVSVFPTFFFVDGRGTIVKQLVSNGQPVEYGETLYLVKPN